MHVTFVIPKEKWDTTNEQLVVNAGKRMQGPIWDVINHNVGLGDKGQ